MSTRRQACGGAFINGCLYIAGGQDLLILTLTLTVTLTLNLTLSRTLTLSLSQTLTLLGGWDGTKQLATAERFQPLLNHWEPISNMKQSRYAAGVCRLGSPNPDPNPN